MKIWLDPGHGGTDGGACALDCTEKEDNLTYALELGRQFQAQGLEPIFTRTTDKSVTLTQRTNLENQEQCALAIACHRNGAGTPTATGLEIWLHSKAPKQYVDWAADICNGIKALGLPLRTGQSIIGKVVPGVYRGFRTDPNANYYANSGTNAPSMLIELGFVSCQKDNVFFAEHYKAACAEIVKASCKFLGVAYMPEGDTVAEHTTRRIAALERELTAEREKSAAAGENRDRLIAELAAIVQKHKGA